jgi:hypothetical protein
LDGNRELCRSEQTKHDPSWKWRGQILHFHSLKPYAFYFDGAVEHRCDPIEEERLSVDFYPAILTWCRHLHAACRHLAYDFPMIAAMPIEVVEKELARVEALREVLMRVALVTQLSYVAFTAKDFRT